MSVNDKITIALPDGRIRTGRITEIISHPTEPYYVVEFDNGEKYGYFQSDIDKDKSRQRIEKTKKWLGGGLFDARNRDWSYGAIRAAWSINNGAIDPITLDEYNYLHDYIGGYTE